ncbi:Rossman fold protein, TIGR00730 family [Candidatus Falkowbacteria bacterium RIFOXYD2_FULL_35_9]|uniref:Cytokinin riboside 5'-monophosphate phosphoribohydrolase n=1 Tax=Candidatus Falkowbacteria bacterium RIFOXYC2_FULL_36_12 TaxID=1798002 RepID=A0A1F5T3K8_9BACT|nr:MAG: Rossman fold protein, TIGR00730 family [Candidatus Falkowbacteria bacterium RIFOXYA2_FULL_35_8]OGF33538.1 MAG: Rossman fold protein, TIGR00730 family [Candidatus Falkowbacteria bacterium RIFOXYC2_FULL_36_12]OGF46544.1 MAG: Rossman fold protein, TIGR00730 family [Candidatus Falkowbacteria bacterium RIFOXYD2_FULL_35_9]
MDRKISLKKMSDITWRIFRIMSEFVEGFQFLSDFNKEVTIFGSARLKPQSKWYTEAEKLGELLVKKKFSVITGGGPGIMEAANKGAFKVDPNKSIGINIQLPAEQRTNSYVGQAKAFYYFFTRKVMLAASAQAYIFFPGGFGTIDEFMEILTLIQTRKMQKTPIILVGIKFWTPLIKWFEKSFRDQYKTIHSEDLKLFNLVDSAEEVMKIVKKSKERTIF